MHLPPVLFKQPVAPALPASRPGRRDAGGDLGSSRAERMQTAGVVAGAEHEIRGGPKSASAGVRFYFLLPTHLFEVEAISLLGVRI